MIGFQCASLLFWATISSFSYASKCHLIDFISVCFLHKFAWFCLHLRRSCSEICPIQSRVLPSRRYLRKRSFGCEYLFASITAGRLKFLFWIGSPALKSIPSCLFSLLFYFLFTSPTNLFSASRFTSILSTTINFCAMPVTALFLSFVSFRFLSTECIFFWTTLIFAFSWKIEVVAGGSR